MGLGGHGVDWSGGARSASKSFDHVTDTPDGPLRITLNSAMQLPTTRTKIRLWLAEAVDRDDIDDILLASGEALANAFEHGEPPVHIRMRWIEPRTLVVTVNDAGHWVISVVRPSRGRGILIMTALMDELTVDTTNGTTVRFTRDFHR
jgi:anti-sigma regulatory factor (Ser/Thr protein kinase)